MQGFKGSRKSTPYAAQVAAEDAVAPPRFAVAADDDEVGSLLGGHGNERVDGVVQGSVIATYMNGPALARNPQLADLLIARALDIPLADLEPLELDAVTQLRQERLR